MIAEREILIGSFAEGTIGLLLLRLTFKKQIADENNKY
jgi:hypothetical protein